MIFYHDTGFFVKHEASKALMNGQNRSLSAEAAHADDFAEDTPKPFDFTLMKEYNHP